MGIFFVYILKSSVCLAVFYLFYRLLLSRENVSSFQPDGVAGHTVALVPFAAGGGDCGEADGGASDDDELGAMAYAGGRAGCGNCFR